MSHLAWRKRGLDLRAPQSRKYRRGCSALQEWGRQGKWFAKALAQLALGTSCVPLELVDERTQPCLIVMAEVGDGRLAVFDPKRQKVVGEQGLLAFSPL